MTPIFVIYISVLNDFGNMHALKVFSTLLDRRVKLPKYFYLNYQGSVIDNPADSQIVPAFCEISMSRY